MKKMAELRSDSRDELVAKFSEEEITRAKEYVERRDRGTAPADAAPVETAPAPLASIGMFMPSTAPELRGRKNLAMFLQRFYTWASVAGCDSALDPEVSIKTSGTPRAELERLYNRDLVYKSVSLATSYEGTRKGTRDNEDGTKDRFPLVGMACTIKSSGRDGR